MNEINPTSGPVYKRLYSFPEMVADLFRSVLPEDALDALNLRSLDKVPADYVGDDFRQRHGDTAWRVRAAGGGGGWAYVLVLLEYQSSSDATMALRVAEYMTMLYRELLRAKALETGPLPPVLPIVLYNGESPWTAAQDVRELIAPTGPALAAYQPSQRYLLLDERHAVADYAGELTRAVAQLEQSRTPAELTKVARVLTDLLGGLDQEEPSAGERETPPRMKELRRAFASWLWVLNRRLQGAEARVSPPPELTLEEVRMTLEERVARWPEPWIEQGKRQGIEQGKLQGIEQGKLQGIEQGRRQGVEQGVEQGKRELLRRQVEARFGAQTADRLAASLRRVYDPQRLDAIAEAVVRCETADDLLCQASQRTPDA